MEQRWDEFERRIEMSNGTDQLCQLRSEFHGSFGASFMTEDIENSMERLNAIHDAFIRKAVYLAEQSVGWKEGDRDKAVSYVLLLFGSGGRQEQTFSSDQDNGIVYEAAPGVAHEVAEQYVAELGDAIQRQLEAIGYPPCDGNVLGSNVFWRRTTSGWGATLREWAELRSFETVRNLLIAADARPASGNSELANRFISEYSAMVQEYHRVLLPRMLESTLRHKVLIGVLGNLLTERYGADSGGIDIKYGIYIPMVNGIRLLALQEGIEATSTLKRIRELKRRGAIRSVTADDWESAFLSVLSFRTMVPTQSEHGFYTNRGKMPAKLLTKQVKKELKRTLRIGAQLQKQVKRAFGSEGRL
ncbi:DUF294 nucleotidyltransferase-like domain-containing protein [Paenibacillus alkalitolerans]|uniref:DUF294 nucleotidyltransferase-like domain-containing protein n=1 Tax=Paenibacillus alkalitolerans TaxID=2799335 RepID=UPI0018F61499|nr:DUF294 nucleotidyltransferase-like domain-containing protein [Paenibacillus alkalitolerans]